MVFMKGHDVNKCQRCFAKNNAFICIRDYIEFIRIYYVYRQKKKKNLLKILTI